MLQSARLEKIKKIVPYRLTGQMSHVVQNTYYNTGELALYGVQMGHDSTIVLKSANNVYDLGYESVSKSSNDIQTINFNSRPCLELNNGLTKHTQTLIAAGGHIITGIRDMSYETFERLINASDIGYSKFFKDIPDNTSYRDYLSWTEGRNPDGYAHYFGIFSKTGNCQTKFGRFVTLTGFEKALGLSRYNRIEAAISPNQKYLLIVGNDSHAKKVVFNIYYFDTYRQFEDQDCARAIDNVDSLSGSYNSYYGYDNYPDNPSELSNAQIRQALDWIHEAFYYDQLVFDINSIPVLSHVELSYTDLLNLTGRDSGKFSFQGFAIDNDKNVYITSGFGPESEEANIAANDWLLMLPNGGKDLSSATRYDLSALSHTIYSSLAPRLGTQLSGLFLEPEGVQVFTGEDGNSLLSITASVHNANAYKTPHDEISDQLHKKQSAKKQKKHYTKHHYSQHSNTTHISRLPDISDPNAPIQPAKPTESIHISTIPDLNNSNITIQPITPKSSTHISRLDGPAAIIQPPAPKTTTHISTIPNIFDSNPISDIKHGIDDIGNYIKDIGNYIEKSSKEDTIGSWNFVCEL